jgi:hypothetical protein
MTSQNIHLWDTLYKPGNVMIWKLNVIKQNHLFMFHCFNANMHALNNGLQNFIMKISLQKSEYQP